MNYRLYSLIETLKRFKVIITTLQITLTLMTPMWNIGIAMSVKQRSSTVSDTKGETSSFAFGASSRILAHTGSDQRLYELEKRRLQIKSFTPLSGVDIPGQQKAQTR
jgi:hypothetical protein